MTETVFTKIITRELPASIIYEDDFCIAFLDITPFEKGHTLVVPKHPYETIMEMPEEEYLRLQKIVLKIAKHYEKTLHCGINIWQNNKKIAGQEVPHVHFHVVPRREVKKTYYRNNDETYLPNEMENYRKKLSLYSYS
jgi:histidine triad (HIT) family protein